MLAPTGARWSRGGAGTSSRARARSRPTRSRSIGTRTGSRPPAWRRRRPMSWTTWWWRWPMPWPPWRWRRRPTYSMSGRRRSTVKRKPAIVVVVWGRWNTTAKQTCPKDTTQYGKKLSSVHNAPQTCKRISSGVLHDLPYLIGVL